MVGLAYDEGCQGGYTGPSGHHTDSGSRWYDLCGLVGRLGGTLRTLRSLCLSFTVGLGVSAVSKDSEDYGSLTGMRCAVVSRRSGIVLTTTKDVFCVADRIAPLAVYHPSFV